MDVLKYAGYAGKIAKIYAMFSITIARNAAVFLLAAMFLIMYASFATNAAREGIWIAPILLAVVWGFLIFQLSAEFLGGRAALMAVFLFAFSPAVLAQKSAGGITTALGLFVAVMYFLRYLKENSRKNLIASGVAFGIAQTFSSSLLLFIFFFPALAILRSLTQKHARHAWRERAAEIGKWLFRIALIFIIGSFAVALPLRQLDAQNRLSVWNEGIAENTAAAYFIKWPLALHALLIAAFFILAAHLRNSAGLFRPRTKHMQTLANTFLKEHFTLIAFTLFILFYKTLYKTTITQEYESIMPLLPFIFLFISSVIIDYLRQKPEFAMEFSFEGMKKIASFYKRKALRYAALFLVLSWYLISVLAHYPHFTSYTNELASMVQKNVE